MDAHRILPVELAAILFAVFAPPLLVAFFVEGWIARRARRGRRLWRFLGAVAVTSIGSLLIGFTIERLAPRAFGPFLRLRDLELGSYSWPVMPLAVVSVAIAAAAASAWLLRENRANDT